MLTVLELLGIGEDDMVSLSVEQGRLIIEPVRREKISEDPRVQAAYDKIVKRYDSAFRKLAKK